MANWSAVMACDVVEAALTIWRAKAAEMVPSQIGQDRMAISWSLSFVTIPPAIE